MKRHSSVFKTVALSVIIATSMSILTGCKTVGELRDDKKQEYAGSVHFAVISNTPWQDCVDDLQPKFPITAGTALLEAGLATQLDQEQQLTAWRAALAVGTATPGEMPVAQYNPSIVPLGETPSSPDTDKKAPAAYDIPGDKLGTQIPMDSFLKYKLAESLYQEVQLKNREVKDALHKEGYDSYVVRMQVTVMPNKRNIPFDVDSTFAFFANNEGLITHRKITVSSDDGASARISPSGITSQELKDELLRRDPAYAQMRAVCFTNGTSFSLEITPEIKRPVYIVPLLVTDNIEGTLRSRSDEHAFQVALEGMAMVNNVGLKAAVDRLSDNIKKMLGRNMNNLLTVGRATDNTLHVKVGAYQSFSKKDGETEYIMPGGTHYVTLLVLVPNKTKSVFVMSNTHLIDSDTGKVLRPRSSEKIDDIYDDIAYRHELATEGTDKKAYLKECRGYLDALADLVLANNLDGYYNYIEDSPNILSKKTPPVNSKAFMNNMNQFGNMECLWLDLTREVLIGMQRSATSFELNKPSDAVAPTDQSLFAYDDTEDSTTITLQGGNDIKPSKLTGILHVKVYDSVAKKFVDDKEYLFVSNKVEATDGKNPTFTFPSLEKWLTKDTIYEPKIVKLETKKSGDSFRDYTTAFYNKKLPPCFSVAVSGGNTITSTGGVGKLTLAINQGGKPAKTSITITGATISDLTDISAKKTVPPADPHPGVSVNADTISVEFDKLGDSRKAAYLTLTLADLHEELPVKIMSKDANGRKAEDIEAKVIKSDTSPKKNTDKEPLEVMIKQ